MSKIVTECAHIKKVRNVKTTLLHSKDKNTYKNKVKRIQEWYIAVVLNRCSL